MELLLGSLVWLFPLELGARNVSFLLYLYAQGYMCSQVRKSMDSQVRIMCLDMQSYGYVVPRV